MDPSIASQNVTFLAFKTTQSGYSTYSSVASETGQIVGVRKNEGWGGGEIKSASEHACMKTDWDASAAF